LYWANFIIHQLLALENGRKKALALLIQAIGAYEFVE
jgi:hypothetical protein